MEKAKILKAIESLMAEAPKRNFTQSFDLIVNLKNLNLKDPKEHVEFFTELPHPLGRKVKVCALVGPELLGEAKQVCDAVVEQEGFDEYADKRKAKGLAKAYDYFLAQANIMQRVAAVFGRTLGPRGKMPNPKAGCVVAPKASIKPLYERLQRTVKISAKKSAQVQLSVAKQDQPVDQVAENVLQLYNQLVHHLPKEEENIKSIAIKLTMSKPVVIE